tara:strand:- start:2344 stop:3723 length:1380 start_codon:yes stop_codon:yes gene_type:complete
MIKILETSKFRDAMKVNLAEYKKNRPTIAPLFDYIERVTEAGFSDSTHSETLPYPENIDRFTKLFLPMFLYPVSSKEFKDMLSFIADWTEHFHFSRPNLMLIKYLANKAPDVYHRLAEGLHGEAGFSASGQAHEGVSTFLQARIIEAAHLAHKGPTIAYHPNLYQMLRLTDTDKLTNIPITMINTPYKSMYLDWNGLNTDIADVDGIKYQGCYVQTRTVTWKAMVDGNIIANDSALQVAYEKGTIKDNEDVLFFDMLFVGKPENNAAMQTTLFSISASKVEGLSIRDAVFDAEEASQHAFVGIPIDDMKEAIALVINTLLYMTAKKSVREEMKEMAGMEKKLLNIKNPAKKRKAQARLMKNTYDYVRIGKAYELHREDEPKREGKQGKQEPHIRLGFFNTFYIGDRILKDDNGLPVKDKDGKSIPLPIEKRAKEVRWVMPYLVNADSLSDISVKPRKVA